MNALRNEYWLTRHWAAVSLGNLKDKRAVKFLIQALQDEHKEVRNMARRALDKLDSKV
ncbi:HEAT repeat domain-containing protein [uncultured Nostoc sp.]|uniref:HEAT repeat domain-containing protein n=1 Tax=uncultured Nostoc sp. TaxID=340711 RepID=UPI0035CCA586